ncbi:glutathione S-transferase family protein [Oceanicola sp. D3]|uniref:glutathione S-transferase family protein n=1 Tax=Oceanicola sp. D3 TaxID=2587163 RepID=UPI001AF00A22|nr:hypothetical protein [Oceanicola sp. D3]
MGAGRYRVATTPFRDRPDSHSTHQPFSQVPWITQGNLSMFESGAILLHIAGQSPKLMPERTEAQAQVTQWLFAALNSVEAASLP